MRNRPRSSVTAVRTFSMSAGLEASTVTPGSTAPDASLATPAMEACAWAEEGRSARQVNTNRTLNRLTRRIGCLLRDTDAHPTPKKATEKGDCRAFSRVPGRKIQLPDS